MRWEGCRLNVEENIKIYQKFLLSWKVMMSQELQQHLSLGRVCVCLGVNELIAVVNISSSFAPKSNLKQPTRKQMNKTQHTNKLVQFCLITNTVAKSLFLIHFIISSWVFEPIRATLVVKVVKQMKRLQKKNLCRANMQELSLFRNFYSMCSLSIGSGWNEGPRRNWPRAKWPRGSGRWGAPLSSRFLFHSPSFFFPLSLNPILD